MRMNHSFPLEQYFDLSKRITKADVAQCEDQMLRPAFKDRAANPYGSKALFEVREMKRAVKAHNQKCDEVQS